MPREAAVRMILSDERAACCGRLTTAASKARQFQETSIGRRLAAQGLDLPPGDLALATAQLRGKSGLCGTPNDDWLGRFFDQGHQPVQSILPVAFLRTETLGNDHNASKRNCTALEILFTFCPPGPEARTKLSSISLSSR